MNDQGLRLELFRESDVEVLTPIMKRAFDEDSRIHLNKSTGGPPGYDNGDFLRKYALHAKSDSYKIIRENIPIGATIVWITASQINSLGCLFIDSELQNQGIGLTVWQYIERKYADTVMWKTETPGFSDRNHYFYVNKCGFKIVKIGLPQNGQPAMYYMEKRMS